MPDRDYEVCYCCGRKLHEDRMQWLELRWIDNTWHLPDTLPWEESQGRFPFGQTCAKKVLAGKEPGHYL